VPQEAEDLKALLVTSGHRDFSADPRYPTYWFSHIDGRYSVCSIVVNVDPLPARCARAGYEFIPKDSGWELVPDDFISCSERR
jgi:hypothetical protein